jgi:hypothetical protein
MPEIYRITALTKSGETHTGLMNRSQPEVVNGFIGIAQEDGGWVYLASDDVLKMQFDPAPAVETETEEK